MKPESISIFLASPIATAYTAYTSKQVKAYKNKLFVNSNDGALLFTQRKSKFYWFRETELVHHYDR